MDFPLILLTMFQTFLLGVRGLILETYSIQEFLLHSRISRRALALAIRYSEMFSVVGRIFALRKLRCRVLIALAQLSLSQGLGGFLFLWLTLGMDWLATSIRAVVSFSTGFVAWRMVSVVMLDKQRELNLVQSAR